MKPEVRKQLYWLIGCVVIIFLSAMMAYALEREFGKVVVTQVRIIDKNGDVVAAKLYRPKTATAENKAPAIINMHGYQNDKDVLVDVAGRRSYRGNAAAPRRAPGPRRPGRRRRQRDVQGQPAPRAGVSRRGGCATSMRACRAASTGWWSTATA